MKDCKCQNKKTLGIVILFALFGVFIFIMMKYVVNNYKLKKYNNNNRNKIIETFNTNSKYSNYNGLERDPLYLSIKNAANISYLKGQMDELYKMREEIRELNAQEKQNAQYNNQVQQEYKDEATGIQNALSSPDENENENGNNSGESMQPQNNENSIESES